MKTLLTLIKHIAIVIMALVVLQSCFESEYYDDIDNQPTPVVNCFLNNADVIQLHLSSTIGFFSSNSSMVKVPAIDNATVEIFENGISLGHATNVGSGFYKIIGKMPLPDKKYSTVIILEDNTKLTGNCVMPLMPDVNFIPVNAKIVRYEKEFITGKEIFEDLYLNCTIEFKDKDVEKSYYMISGGYKMKNPLYFRGSILVDKLDDIIINEEYGAFSFQDSTSAKNFGSMVIPGKTLKKLNNKINLDFVNSIGDTPQKFYYIAVYKVDELYYQYAKAAANYCKYSFDEYLSKIEVDTTTVYEQGIDFSNGFNEEPVIFPNNINGGIGLFTGAGLKYDSVKISDYLNKQKK